MLDLTFVPLLEAIADKLPTVERYIVLTDAAHMPQTTLKNAVAYEDWIAEADGDFTLGGRSTRIPRPALCYTSGTTGNPKGVLYSHRSNVLHALMANRLDCAAASRPTTSMLPVVPMFHANAWGFAFSAPDAGAKLVMPGAKLDGASVYELLETEKVTFTAARADGLADAAQHMQKRRARSCSTLKRVVIGGSACPPAMIRAFEDDYGVEVRHAWGMTEMSPIGTVGAIKPQFGELAARSTCSTLKTKQG